jgi:hypothetical protein
MSLLAGFVRAAFPVGSVRRDRVLGGARRAGLIPAPPESSYQRWQKSFESTAGISDDAVVGNDIAFVVHVGPGRNDPAAVTRTLVSLTNQTFNRWTATLTEMSGAPTATNRVVTDARHADKRLGVSGSVDTLSRQDRTYNVHIRFGDALAPTALMELAAAATRHPAVSFLSAEFDMIDPFTGLRSAPAAIGAWEPDLAEQFDFMAGFVATLATGSTAAEVISTGMSSSHVGSVLLHRLVGPRERALALLPPAISNPPLPGRQASPYKHGGTRVTHPVPAGINATVVVRDPLSHPVTAQRQLANLIRSAGVHVTVEATNMWMTGHAFPKISDDVDVVAIVDGGLTPQANGWLDDLAGALLRDHVFAVAPLLTVPSGVVFDAGVVMGSDGLMARSGRLDFAPFELARCRQVATLSGRAFVVRRKDLPRFTAAQSDSLMAAAATAGQTCLVWAHQRWALDVGLTASPTDSPMLAWSRGRLKTWFDDGITPHQPEPGRIGEGVW